jgi:hypothetical protein
MTSLAKPKRVEFTLAAGDIFDARVDAIVSLARSSRHSPRCDWLDRCTTRISGNQLLYGNRLVHHADSRRRGGSYWTFGATSTSRTATSTAACDCPPSATPRNFSTGFMRRSLNWLRRTTPYERSRTGQLRLQNDCRHRRSAMRHRQPSQPRHLQAQDPQVCCERVPHLLVSGGRSIRND